MALEIPEMKRAILGYRRSTVDQVIAERDDLYHKAVKDKSELGIALDAATEELEALKAKLAELGSELEEERARAAELDGRLQAAEASVQEAEQANAELEERLLEERRSIHAAEGRLEVAAAEIESQRELGRIATERADQAGERALVAEEEVRRLTRELASASSELEALRVRSDAASAQAEQHRARADELEAQTTQLRVELERAEGQLERVSSTLEDTRTELEELRAAPERPAGEGSSAPAEGPFDIVTALEMAEDAMGRIIGEGRRRLSDEVEVLEQRRTEVATELDDLQGRVAALASIGSNVGNAVREARGSIEGVERAIAAALDPLIGSLAAVDREMSALGEAIDRIDAFGVVGPQPPSSEHDEQDPIVLDAHDDASPSDPGTDEEPSVTTDDEKEPSSPPAPSGPSWAGAGSGQESERHGGGVIHWLSRGDDAI